MKTRNKILIAAAVAMVGLWKLRRNKPKKAIAVQDFDVQKYTGFWYEIARFDYRFEEEMNNVSAQYKMDRTGRVQVLNSGWQIKKERWQKADGVAKFRGEENVGELKVSFFGPFYSGYNVVALEGDYQYALVAGKNLDYLWILSRTKSIPDKVKKKFLKEAETIGYDTSNLIWVNHDRDDNPYVNAR